MARKEDILKFYEFLNHKKQSELRLIEPLWKIEKLKTKPKPVQKWVNDKDEFLKTVEEFNERYNMYIGLNERKLNGDTDEDVEFITNIGHDIDAHGKEGDLGKASEMALKLKDDCSKFSYQEPLVLCSGRGFWVIHHTVPIENTEENRKKIKEFGNRIKKKYECKGIEFDSTVYNPSRIARIAGTLNISEKDNQINAFIVNEPEGKEDFKLADDILNIEIKKPQIISGAKTLKENCPFLDYCLTHEIPKGERHKIISRNMALYICDNPDRELLEEQYYKIQKGSETELKQWLKNIDEGGKEKYPFSCGELINFQKKYKIPLKCKGCPKFEIYKKEKRAEEKLQEEIAREKREETIKKDGIFLFSAFGSFSDYLNMAREFYETQPFHYDRTRIWWFWNFKDYKWEIVDETDLVNAIDYHTQNPSTNSKIKGEILEALKRIGRLKKPEEINPIWIQFKDTLVDINTGEKFKATPEYFVTNSIPYKLHNDNYEQTPVMDKIFEEWVGKDYVKTLYEIIAYCLLPSYPIHRLFCLIGSGMNGKCQKGEDLILMADGSWKKIKEVKVNEEIISPQKDGSYKFSKIINIHNRFEKEVYDIYEKNRKKRLLYTCAGNHIIPIIRNWTKRTSKDDSTPRIRERRLFEYDTKHISKLDNSKSQICSFTTTAIEYRKPDTKINPYCLGAWLGDGYFSIRKWYRGMKNPKRNRGKNGWAIDKGLGITTEDKNIVNEFHKNYNEDIRGISYKENNNANTYRLSVNGKFANELTQLKLCGKGSGEKFIPKECLLSSINYRKELLAGLIDTDGFVQKKTGSIYYTTKSKQLSEDIKNLVFSLGGYCEIRNVKKKSQYGSEGKYFELSIQFKNYDIPLRLKRKKERLSNRKYSPRNIAIEVIKTKPQQVYGIEIEGNSKWYITNNWMITHNSKFLELLRKFIGKKNVTSTELDSLISSRFEITRLHKKLVCQMGETNFNEISKTSIIKKLTGDDLIGFEYKNKDPFEEKNYAKIIIATNNLPTTTDKTIGFYRRWTIIDFPNQFSEEKDILEEIPEEEYESLALKCTGLLKDLLKKRRFHNEGSVEQRMERYESKSDFLQKFLNEFVVEDLNESITKADFNKKFIGWCVENRHRKLAENTLGRKMKEKGIEMGRKYVDWLYDGKGGQIRVWLGLKWKE